MLRQTKIEISSRTIIFAFFVYFFIQFLWLIKDLLFSLLIAFIIMSAVRPLVGFLEQRRIPRALSAAIFLIGIAGGIGYLFLALVPPLVVETAYLFRNLPEIVNRLNPILYSYLNLNSFSTYLPSITNQAYGVVRAIFSNVVFVLSTLFFSFYFIVEKDIIKKSLAQFFSQEAIEEIAATFSAIEKKMSAWLWGEMILMAAVGTAVFVGLNLVGVSYSLPLAILAGVLEVVPTFGPIVSTIPAILIAAGHSYFLVLSVVALYFIVQQLENNLLVPMVMKKAVGLHPIISLLSLIIGGKIAGVLGVLLAIPTTLFFQTLILEMVRVKKQVFG